MERREAPGVCEAPWWQPVLYFRTAGRTLPERVCEARSDGFARPIPRPPRAVILERAKLRHRTAAPPGAPPAGTLARARGRITSLVVGGPPFARDPPRHDVRRDGAREHEHRIVVGDIKNKKRTRVKAE